MSTRMRNLLTGGLGELRYEPTAKRIRAVLDGRVVADIAWTYQQPLHDAAQVRGLIAFFSERLDIIVDGERLDRPITPRSAKPGT